MICFGVFFIHYETVFFSSEYEVGEYVRYQPDFNGAYYTSQIRRSLNNVLFDNDLQIHYTEYEIELLTNVKQHTIVIHARNSRQLTDL